VPIAAVRRPGCKAGTNAGLGWSKLYKSQLQAPD